MARVYEAIREAVRTKPKVLALWEMINAECRRDWEMAVADVGDQGPLSAGLDDEIPAGSIWVHNDAGLFQMLVYSYG